MLLNGHVLTGFKDVAIKPVAGLIIARFLVLVIMEDPSPSLGVNQVAVFFIFARLEAADGAVLALLVPLIHIDMAIRGQWCAEFVTVFPVTVRIVRSAR